MKKKYDIAIIGAGIGGLVCGCYLSKLGVKVIIIEKNQSVGGYCGGFTTNGYKFDIGPHYLGGIKHGVIRALIDDLNLCQNSFFNRFNPTDTIVTENKRVSIFTNPHDTMIEFQKKFNREKSNIRNFFTFMLQKDPLKIYIKLKKMTFRIMLDNFFNTDEIKKMLEVLICGNVGVLPEKLQAFNSVSLLRSYIFDSGYYPSGGMQNFSELLSKYFISNGGKLSLSSQVTALNHKNGIIKSAIVNGDTEIIIGKAAVANIDPHQLRRLLDIKQNINYLKKYASSYSAIVLYLGFVNNTICEMDNYGCIWNLINDYNFYKTIDTKKIAIQAPLVADLIYSPSSHNRKTSANSNKKDTLIIFRPAPYLSEFFWKRYSHNVCDQILNNTKKTFPFLKDLKIKFKTVATPPTFLHRTLNTNGAILGTNHHEIIGPQNCFGSVVKNLFLAGAWYTHGGVNFAAVSGKLAAQSIVNSTIMGKSGWSFKLTKI